MTMRRALFTAALVAIVLHIEPIRAAGPYDGSWSGTVEGAGFRCPPGEITMTIAGDKVTGNLHLGSSLPKFSGTVSADGSVSGLSSYPEYSFKANLTGKITGADFTGSLNSIYATTNSSCVRNVSAKRS